VMLVRKLDFDKVTCCCNSKNCIVKYVMCWNPSLCSCKLNLRHVIWIPARW
jgi:hypothetical protein